MMRTLMILLALVPVVAQAQEPAPAARVNDEAGNLPADFYPRSPCIKPRKKPQLSDGMAENVLYNREVTLFNPCIQSYLENAKRDVAYILNVVNAAASDGPVAQTPAGGGNLSPGFYPPSPCVKPDPELVGKPPGVRDKAMAAYNLRVKQLNEAAAAFSTCNTAYVSHARNDIAHVQATLDAALAPRAKDGGSAP